MLGGEVNRALDALRRLKLPNPIIHILRILISYIYTCICQNELTLKIYIKDEPVLKVS